MQWKSNKYFIFWVCVCSLRYPTCKAHAPCRYLWPVLLYNIFPHYLIKGAIFRKKLLKIKCAFCISLHLLSEKFLIIRRSERDMIKIYIGFHVNLPLFLSDFKETWIFSADFRKVLKYQISHTSVQSEASCSMRPAWRTDRLTDKTKLTVTFRNFVNAPKNDWDLSLTNRNMWYIFVFAKSRLKFNYKLKIVR